MLNGTQIEKRKPQSDKNQQNVMNKIEKRFSHTCSRSRQSILSSATLSSLTTKPKTKMMAKRNATTGKKIQCRSYSSTLLQIRKLFQNCTPPGNYGNQKLYLRELFQDEKRTKQIEISKHDNIINDIRKLFYILPKGQTYVIDSSLKRLFQNNKSFPTSDDSLTYVSYVRYLWKTNTISVNSINTEPFLCNIRTLFQNEAPDANYDAYVDCSDWLFNDSNKDIKKPLPNNPINHSLSINNDKIDFSSKSAEQEKNSPKMSQIQFCLTSLPSSRNELSKVCFCLL